MARAIVDRRPHRANGSLAFRALAVMAGLLDAAVEGRKVDIAAPFQRPAPLIAREPRNLLSDTG